jgi:hypothetical protein
MAGRLMRTFAPVMVLAAALAGGPARAQDAPEPARAHFDRGAALAAEHRYAEAAREFKAAYEGDPGKEALFAWAQVERLAAHCADAVSLYRQFLAQPDLTAPQREAAELNLSRCEAAPDKPEPAIEPPSPTVAVPPPAASPPVAVAPAPPLVITQPRRSRQAVLVGAALLVGSAAALAGSTTFFILARSDEGQASSAAVFDDYYRAAVRARDRQRIAAAALSAGVLLAGGALLQWMFTQPAPRLSAWLGPAAAGLGGRF